MVRQSCHSKHPFACARGCCKSSSWMSSSHPRSCRLYSYRLLFTRFLKGGQFPSVSLCDMVPTAAPAVPWGPCDSMSLGVMGEAYGHGAVGEDFWRCEASLSVVTQLCWVTGRPSGKPATSLRGLPDAFPPPCLERTKTGRCQLQARNPEGALGPGGRRSPLLGAAWDTRVPDSPYAHC